MCLLHLSKGNYLLSALSARSRSLFPAFSPPPPQSHLYSKLQPGIWSHTRVPPEPLSGRERTGRNHWSQVPVTRGENLRVVVPFWGRSHPLHKNIPKKIGTEFALDR